jgi:hypothetical protein
MAFIIYDEASWVVLWIEISLVYNVSFFSGWFQDFLFTFGYVMLRYSFLCIHPAWALQFLSLYLMSFTS